jgi:hypothetical protein
VSENSIVVRQRSGTFGSFEISNLERLTNSTKDGVTMLEAPGHVERPWNFCGSQPDFVSQVGKIALSKVESGTYEELRDALRPQGIW